MFNDLTPLAPAFVGAVQQDFPPDAGPLAQAELIRLRLKLNRLEQRMTAIVQPAAQAVPSDSSTADQIMARADEYAHVYSFVRDNTMPIARDALRAVVERVVQERDALLAQPAAQAVPAVEACWHWYSDEEGEWRLKGPPLGGLTEGAEVRLYDQATVDRLRELTERAEAERDALKAQIAAQAVHSDVERDAARYRWLRGDTCPDHSPRWMEWEVRRWAAPRWTDDLRRADLDAAIDAAMIAAAPEGKL
jgi:hypothetical protein